MTPSPSPSTDPSPALEPDEGVGFLAGRGGFGFKSPVPLRTAGGRLDAVATGRARTRGFGRGGRKGVELKGIEEVPRISGKAYDVAVEDPASSEGEGD